MKNLHIGILAAIFGLAGVVAVAQTYPPPTLPLVTPTDLIQDLPGGNPSVGNKYITPSQITSQSGYYKSIPANGFTFTFANNQTYAAFAPSGALAESYITLAPAPSDGARECIFSTQTLTTTTISANTGQSINNAITTLAANAGACYLYSASNLTWDRD